MESLKNDERFKVAHEEGSSIQNAGKRLIIVDKLTGVNYLWVNSGCAGGLTLLIDKDGKPIISDIDDSLELKYASSRS